MSSAQGRQTLDGYSDHTAFTLVHHHKVSGDLTLTEVIMSNVRDNDRGLVILSFGKCTTDGGGVRGLSSLLILKECMARLQGQLGLDRPPEVHEYFDMIGGTGTGGISATMLGRLKMPLDNAIEQFAKLAKDVFSDKKYLSASGTGSFKSTKMQQALKCIVSQATGNQDEKMLDRESNAVKCKTVVFAMSERHLNAGRPCAFRSYGGAPNQMPDCTIWEALCATTAHPDLFKSIEIGGELRESFVDGGLGCSNPLAHILSEVKLTYPTRHISCVVSIGAGHVKTIQIPRFRLFQRLLPTNAIEAMKAIATDAEQEAQRMALRFGGVANVYFRLNVDQGLQSLDLCDWERFHEVTAHARGYLHLVEISNKISELAASIRERKQAIAAIQIDGQILVKPEPDLPTVDSPAVGTPVCRQPTSLFIEREQPVHKLTEYLLGAAPKRKIFVLHGLGGAGKTQMALHIVEKTRNHWSDVIFVDATSTETIKTAFADFSRSKRIGDTYEDAWKWLAANPTRWLLVIDNADDPKLDPSSYVPECSHGSILITTRNRGLLELAPGKESSHSVSGMEPDEALQLLLKASLWEHAELTAKELEAAEKLLEEFGRLPLAVVQAGRYIRRTECGFSQYYELYLKGPGEMLQPKDYDHICIGLDKYEKPAFDAWMLSYRLLKELARRLLWLMGYMQRDRITQEIFQRAALNVRAFKPSSPLLETEANAYNYIKDLLDSFLLPDGGWDSKKFLEAMGELRSFSLVDYDRATKFYVLHPLVQTWAKHVAPKELSSTHISYLLASSLKWDAVSKEYGFLRSVHFHINTVFQHDPDMCTDVATCFAHVFYKNGQWDQALLLQHRVLKARRQVLGEENSHTLRAMRNLASIYHKQRRLLEAEKMQLQALQLSERIHGRGHPDTLKVANGLASTYLRQGKLEQAEDMQVQVLDARKQRLGEEHSETLDAMANLANTYYKQGHVEKAEKLELRALHVRKTRFGPEDPHTLRALANLAETYCKQERHGEAKELLLQVLEARKRLLGTEHPATLRTMIRMAHVYKALGQDCRLEYESIKQDIKRLKAMGISEDSGGVSPT